MSQVNTRFSENQQILGKQGMQSICFKQLNTEVELIHFAQNFKLHGNVDIPVEYFKNCDVIACLNKKMQMIGGYAVATGKHIGWLKKTPYETDFQKKIPASQMIELNGVWLAKDFRSSSTAARFWLKLSKDLGSRKVKYITFGCDTSKYGLLKLYNKAASGVIYEGQLTTATPDRTFKIWWSTPRKFRFVKFMYILELGRRFARTLFREVFSQQELLLPLKKKEKKKEKLHRQQF